MLTILDPDVIASEVELINELRNNGLDHLTTSPALGWNYLLDHVWFTKEIGRYLAENTHRQLTILDVGCGRSRFHGFLEKKFGVNIIGIDRPEGYCHQVKSENIDYYADFLELDVFPENSVDIIYWLSAIEHNEKEEIRQLFQKSMSLIKEEGLFLATFSVCEHTHWFRSSEQMNLSIADSMAVFDVNEVCGDFNDIKAKYRDNKLLLREKYQNRYKRFGPNDPAFIVGAVHKMKAKTTERYLHSQAIDNAPCSLYLFVPSNDTHVHWMYPLARALDKSAFMAIAAKNERAEYYLTKLGEKFFVYQPGLLSKVRPGVVVFGCDWGGHERQVIQEAKALGIPTVCIQEGCLDFQDERANRMMYADYAFLQGPVMRKYFRKDKNVIVTGNPKYDSLYETALPEKVKVMINCNFTYKIYEEVRDQWVQDVVGACKELGLDLFISKHPRDKGILPDEYPVISSDAFKIQKQLENSSILVSRFSTIIYDALAMGREVVYYNPHREPFRIFAQDDTGGIRIANNCSELISSISAAVKNLGKNRENRHKFLIQHCNTLNHDTVKRCAESLQAIVQKDTEALISLSAPADEYGSGIVGESDKQRPTVSVIIPCYNTAEYLPEAIESVLAQTREDFEIIVIDDASTDNTAEVARSFGDSRIKYVRHRVNMGLASSRNTGLRQARGKYITFLDADDYFLPNKLKDQVAFLENYPDYGLVCGGFLRVDEDGNVLRECATEAYPIIPEEILARNRFVVHSTLIRREWIERVGYFDESLRTSEDWDFHYRLAMAGCMMYRTSNIVCAYRFRHDSLSVDPQRQMNGMLKVIEKIFANKGQQSQFSEAAARAKGYMHMRAATYYYALNNTRQARYHFAQALRYNQDFYEGRYCHVITFLLHHMDQLNVDSPTQYFETVFDNLPEEARGMRSLRQRVIHQAMSHRLLNSYKDKHRGQRCVIIGNGPSLRKMDLSFLKNEITFGLDQFYLMNDKIDFSPTYYICLNPLLVDQNPDEIQSISSTKFLNLDVLPYISDPSGIIWLRRTHKLLFAKDPREGGLGNGRTTTFLAMQLAYFMGFDEVILIGEDHNFITAGGVNQQMVSDENGTGHLGSYYFGEDEQKIPTDLEKVEVAYQMAKKNFTADGRRIVDATLDSKMSIFSKADYRELFFAKSDSATSGQPVSVKQFGSTDFDSDTMAEQGGEVESDTAQDHVIKWANPWDELKPDAVTNLYAIACSYISLSKFDSARFLFEKISGPLEGAIDGVDFKACSDFANPLQLAKCFLSVCTQLAKCYRQQGALDKIKQIYSNLLRRGNLRMPEPQKQDMLRVLKKLETLPVARTIPEPVVQSDQFEDGYLVSAMIYTCNSEQLISGCLEDLENQTIADKLEIIVVNSGSEQNVDVLVKQFQQKYDNIVYIKTKHQEGVFAAWNRAIKAAHGKYITNANTEDRHRRDALEILARELENNLDVAVVYSDQIVTKTPNDTFENNHGTETAVRPEYSRERLLFGNCTGSQPMWHISLHNEFGYFDETLTNAGNWDFWLRVSQRYKLKHINEPLGLYYHNEEQISCGEKIHNLYERYIVGKRYGNPYISIIPEYKHRDNPLVSVVMAAYNAADHIAEAIESVLIQNYRNFELIIVNDGSTDNTEDIAASFKDDKIKYFYQENAGLATTLNEGIKKSQGDFVIKLDSDDMMTPDFIAKHLQEFEKHSEADLVYCDDCLIGEDGKPIRVIARPEYTDRKMFIRDLFRYGHPVVPFRTCIRRSVFDKIGPFDESLLIGEDYDMMRRFVKSGLQMHHLKGALYLRQMAPDSLSRNCTAEKAKCYLSVLKQFIETFDCDELFPEVEWDKIAPDKRQLLVKCLAAKTCLSIGQTYVKSNLPVYAKIAFEQAHSELRDSLKIDPGNQQVQQLLQKCESARARYAEIVQQAVC